MASVMYIFLCTLGFIWMSHSNCYDNSSELNICHEFCKSVDNTYFMINITRTARRFAIRNVSDCIWSFSTLQEEKFKLTVVDYPTGDVNKTCLHANIKGKSPLNLNRPCTINTFLQDFNITYSLKSCPISSNADYQLTIKVEALNETYLSTTDEVSCIDGTTQNPTRSKTTPPVTTRISEEVATTWHMTTVTAVENSSEHAGIKADTTLSNTTRNSDKMATSTTDANSMETTNKMTPKPDGVSNKHVTYALIFCCIVIFILLLIIIIMCRRRRVGEEKYVVKYTPVKGSRVSSMVSEYAYVDDIKDISLLRMKSHCRPRPQVPIRPFNIRTASTLPALVKTRKSCRSSSTASDSNDLYASLDNELDRKPADAAAAAANPQRISSSEDYAPLNETTGSSHKSSPRGAFAIPSLSYRKLSSSDYEDLDDFIKKSTWETPRAISIIPNGQGKKREPSFNKGSKKNRPPQVPPLRRLPIQHPDEDMKIAALYASVKKKTKPNVEALYARPDIKKKLNRRSSMVQLPSEVLDDISSELESPALPARISSSSVNITSRSFTEEETSYSVTTAKPNALDYLFKRMDLFTDHVPLLAQQQTGAMNIIQHQTQDHDNHGFQHRSCSESDLLRFGSQRMKYQ